MCSNDVHDSGTATRIGFLSRRTDSPAHILESLPTTDAVQRSHHPSVISGTGTFQTVLPLERGRCIPYSALQIRDRFASLAIVRVKQESAIGLPALGRHEGVFCQGEGKVPKARKTIFPFLPMGRNGKAHANSTGKCFQ